MIFLGETRLPDAPRFIAERKRLTPDQIGERRTAWDELWSATDEAQSLTQNANAKARAMQEAYKARAAAIQQATGIDPFKLSKAEIRARLRSAPYDPAQPWAAYDGMESESGSIGSLYANRLRELEQQFPQHRDVIRAEVPIEEDAAALARASEGRAQAANARAAASGLSPASRFGASLGGGFRAMLRDPVQVGTLFVAGGGPSAAKTVFGKVLQTVLTEAVINGGVEAAVQALGRDWKQKAGLDASVETSLRQVGLAAVFGGAFGGLLEGGRAAIQALNAPVADTVLERAVAGDRAAAQELGAAIGRPLNAQDIRIMDSAAESDAMDAAAWGADLEDSPRAQHLAAAMLDAAEADAPMPQTGPRPGGLLAKIIDRASEGEAAPPASAVADAAPAVGREPVPAKPVAKAPAKTPLQLQEDRLMRELAPKAAKARKPLTLRQFVASIGGVRDEGGEMRARDFQRLFLPGHGRMVRETGKSLDYAREAAAEAGYLDRAYGSPEEAMARSTVNDFLDALDADTPSNPVYASTDADLLNARQAADEVTAQRETMRQRIRDVLQYTDGPPLPDSIIARAVELSDEFDNADDALERAILEDYNRDDPGVTLERADGSEFEIPFFDDSWRMPAERGQAAPGSGDAPGEAGLAAEARGPVRDAGAAEGTPSGVITAATLRPSIAIEPGTKEGADLAALAVAEASRAAKPAVDRINALYDAMEGVYAKIDNGEPLTAADRATIAAHVDAENAANRAEALAEIETLQPLAKAGGFELRLGDKRRTVNADLNAAYTENDIAIFRDGQPVASVRSAAAAVDALTKGSNVAVEKTDAGLQVLMPGVAEVTVKDRLDVLAAKPMRGGNKAAGGLFDETVTKQMDIMDMIPAGTDADGRPLHVSHADLIEEAERADFFGDLIASCKE